MRACVSLVVLLLLPAILLADPPEGGKPFRQGASAESAGGAMPEETGRGAGPPAFFELDQSALWLPGSDLDGPDGELGESRFATTLAWSSFAGPNRITRASFAYARRNYDFSGAEPYAGSFDTTNSFRVGGTVERPFSGPWSAFVSSGVSVQAAEGADFRDGWNVPFVAGVGYLVSRELYLSAGLLGILEAETGGFVVPIVGLRWRPNDRFSVMTLNGVRATYKLGKNREWELLGSVLYETFVFAVDDLEGFRRREGVVSQEYWLARFGVSRGFGRMFEVGAYLEGRFSREFEYIDDDRRFDGFDVDPGLGLRIVGSYRF